MNAWIFELEEAKFISFRRESGHMTHYPDMSQCQLLRIATPTLSPTPRKSKTAFAAGNVTLASPSGFVYTSQDEGIMRMDVDVSLPSSRFRLRMETL